MSSHLLLERILVDSDWLELELWLSQSVIGPLAEGWVYETVLGPRSHL